MASNFIRTPSLGASPLLQLASYFEEARKRVGIISLPKETLEIIKQRREHSSQHSETEVEAIVRALEPRDSQLCTRLDSMGLVILCSVFVHSQTCLAQQRGLSLLSEALYVNELEPSSQTDAIIAKKVAIGPPALQALIKGFVLGSNPDQTRRWMGVLALELLKGCPQSCEILQSDPEKLQSLSEVINHGKCQVLKLLAGSMINEMQNHGVTPELMWPSKTNRELYSNFPRAQARDTQWVTSFEGFVDELVVGNVLTQERSIVLFAFALFVGNSRYSIDDESAIVVTASEGLNIIIPESATGPAQYIDVPLENIYSVTIDSKPNSQSQTPFHALILELASDSDDKYYVNAAGHDQRSIALAFTSRNDAKTLKSIILPNTVDTHNMFRQNISEGVDVSSGHSDDKLATLYPRSNEDSVTAASRTASLIIQNPQSGAIRSAANGLENRDQRFSMAKNEQGHRNAQMMEHTIHMTKDSVDVSRPPTLDNTQADIETEHQPAAINANGPVCTHRPVINGISGPSMPKGFGQISDFGPPSTLNHRQGLKAIENGPEFPTQSKQFSEQQTSKDQNAYDQTDDYDSSYDASPKRQKFRPDHSLMSMAPPPLLRQSRTQDQNPIDEPSVGPRVKVPWPLASDLDAPSKSQQSRKPKVGDPRISPPNTGDGTAEQVSSTKLSRMLQDGDGKVEVGIDSEPGAETGHEKRSKAKKPQKATALASIKSKARAQKRPQLTKKITVLKSKAKANVDQVSDEIDEYDLPASSNSSKAATKPRSKADPPPDDRVGARTAPSVLGSRQAAQDTKLHPIVHLPSKTTASDPETRKKIDLEDMSIWDEGLATSDDSPKNLQPKLTAAASKISISNSKEKKAPAKPKPKAKAKAKAMAKAAPIALTQPRLRRAAATKANKKIQGLQEDDEITDIDDTVSKPEAKASSAAVPMHVGTSKLAPVSKHLLIKLASDSQGTPVGDHPICKPPDANDVSDYKNNKSRHDPRDCGKPNPGSNVEASSPDNVDLLRNPSELPTPRPHNDTSLKDLVKDGDLTEGVSELPSVQEEERVKKSHSLVRHGKTRNKQHQQRERHSIPASGPKKDIIPDTEASMSSDPPVEEYQQTEEIGMLGDTEDSHFQGALPDTDDGFSRSEDAQTKAVIPQETNDAQRPKERGDSSTMIELSRSIAQVKDPFGAKLSLLVPEAMGGKEKPKGVAPAKDQTSKARKKTRIDVSTTSDAQPDKKSQKARHPHEIKPPKLQKAMEVKGEQQETHSRSSKLPKPAIGNKRKAEQDSRAEQKRIKTARQDNISITTATNPVDQEKNSKTPLPVVGRKTELISWDISGPRNQGTISTKKPTARRIIFPQEEIDGQQPDLGQPNLKRKIAPYLDDPASWEHDHFAKRHRQDVTTPRHNRKHVPKMISEPNPLLIHEMTHQLSSQSARVDENGSPMPFKYSAKEIEHTRGALDSVHVTFEDDGFMIQDGDDDQDEPQLPTLDMQRATGSQFEDLKLTGIFSNSKQLPSSPHAPSTFASILKHHEYHNGEFILNPETLETIAPVAPQDPFISTSNKNPPSSFMKLLQKSSALEARRKNSEVKQQGPAGGMKSKSLAFDDDPDKTLVEPELKRKKAKHYTVSDSSATSGSTSSNTSLVGDEQSEEESDDDTKRWRKTLEPHQANTLDLLTVITHRLVRYLVDKETAVKDIINNYAKGGEKLLEGYEKERQKALDTNQAGLEQTKRALSAMFLNAQTKLRNTSGEIHKRQTQTRGLEARWKERQEQTKKAMNAAVALCLE